MTKKKESKVYQLVICHTCNNHIKTNESYTIWEDSIYCEPCFDIYMELVGLVEGETI